MPLVVRVMTFAIFGVFGLYSLACVLSRKVAFRVNQSGITLGGDPFRYRSTTRLFPWADISKIVIWQRELPVTIWRWTVFSLPIRYIGLQRHPGAPPVSGDGTGRLDRAGFTAPVEGIAAGAARKVTAWKLNADQLAIAVATYAPNVPVEDTNSSSAVPQL
jgi:hypothetical protein